MFLRTFARQKLFYPDKTQNLGFKMPINSSKLLGKQFVLTPKELI